MNNSLFPCGSCPIDNITGIWKLKIPASENGATYSIPGHLLHYIISGSYKVKIGKKEYYPKEGDMLYYYGSEEVIWESFETDIDFYSVGFTGSFIPVLSPDDRVIQATSDIRNKWEKLWKTSIESNKNSAYVLSYSILLDLISSIFWKQDGSAILPLSNKWLKIENHIRSEKLYHISPDQLAQKAGLSRSSLYSLCRKETGATPLKLLKDIRTEEAKGILKYTEMRIGEISDYLGFKRIHDFSREFKLMTGISPKKFRDESNL
ncbi:MAG: AraC family transcriptional regulator [Spirochaetaceae bacterium]